MKHLALIIISVMLVGGNADARPLRVPFDADAFRAELDETNLDEKIKDEIFFAYVDYNASSTKLKELMELNGLNKPKSAPKSISADLTDPTIKAIREQVKKTHNRFGFLNPTFHVREQNPSSCWGFAHRSSLHSRFRRVGSFA